MSPSPRARLPFPYRAELEVVSTSLAQLQGGLDWPARSGAIRRLVGARMGRGRAS